MEAIRDYDIPTFVLTIKVLAKYINCLWYQTKLSGNSLYICNGEFFSVITYKAFFSQVLFAKMRNI